MTTPMNRRSGIIRRFIIPMVGTIKKPVPRQPKA
jgi:hypothetical protein